MLKDYDLFILYHLDKENVVGDALNRKAVIIESLAFFLVLNRPLVLDIQPLDDLMIQLNISKPRRILSSFEARSNLLE